MCLDYMRGAQFRREWKLKRKAEEALVKQMRVRHKQVNRLLSSPKMRPYHEALLHERWLLNQETWTPTDEVDTTPTPEAGEARPLHAEEQLW